jgi:hypothetical protein
VGSAPDSDPVRTCKTCHNEAGYSAYCGKQGESPCLAADKVTDPIVRRVHGVHRGAGLLNPFNTDPATGNFAAFMGVEFPADLRMCDKCHTDDSWHTKPTTEACVACHDNLDLPNGVLAPPRVLGKPAAGACKVDADCKGADWPNVASKATCDVPSGNCQLGFHIGGKQAGDSGCKNCHGDGQLSDITVAHGIAPKDQATVGLTMSAPGNGKYFVAGEKPAVKITVTDANGKVVDPATFTTCGTLYNSTCAAGQNWKSMNLYVSGPRSGPHTPVLTTAAKGVAGLRAFAPYPPPYGPVPKFQPYNLSTVTGFQVAIDGAAPMTVDMSACTFADKTKATALEIATCLNGNQAFKAVATAKSASTSYTGSSKSYVVIYGGKRGGSVQIMSNAATDLNSALGATLGTYAPIETRSTLSNALTLQIDPLDEDPALLRTNGANGFMTYSLGDVASLLPGTYIAYIEVSPATGLRGWAKAQFQVGTATEDKLIATNCKSCHEDTRVHDVRVFDTDVCQNCHDDQHQLSLPANGSIASPSQWTYGSAAKGAPQGLGQNGFGCSPIMRRAHGAHRGAYLAHPDQQNGTAGDLTSGWTTTLMDIIFPQDIRSCQTCHSAGTSWKDSPSRVACLSCHDSDSAQAHGTLMTIDPTPASPFSGDETESCGACHGANTEFSAEKVHNVTTPYVPPYPRAE